MEENENENQFKLEALAQTPPAGELAQIETREKVRTILNEALAVLRRNGRVTLEDFKLLNLRVRFKVHQLVSQERLNSFETRASGNTYVVEFCGWGDRYAFQAYTLTLNNGIVAMDYRNTR